MIAAQVYRNRRFVLVQKSANPENPKIRVRERLFYLFSDSDFLTPILPIFLTPIFRFSRFSGSAGLLPENS